MSVRINNCECVFHGMVNHPPSPSGARSQADAKQRPRQGDECNPRSFTAAVIHSLVARLLTAARRHSGLRLFNDLSCTRRDVRSPFAGQSSTSFSGPRGALSLLHLPPAADRWEVQMEAQMLRFNPVTVRNCTVPLLVVERRLPPLRVRRIIKLDIPTAFLPGFLFLSDSLKT